MYHKRIRAFTLIELLVVIAIIAILAAILFPVFAKARDRAKSTACLNNLKQIATAFRMYADDNNNAFPPGQGDVPWLVPAAENPQYPTPFGYRSSKSSLVPMARFHGRANQQDVLLAYIKSAEVFVCPSTVKGGSGWKLSLSVFNPTSYWYCNYEVLPEQAAMQVADEVNPGMINPLPAGATVRWLGANGGPKRVSPSTWMLAQDAYIDQAHLSTKKPGGGSFAMINRVYYDGHVGALKYQSQW